MIIDDHRPGRATYEVRINGLLGPLLLRTLPHAAVSLEPQHTLFVTSGRAGADLLDVLQVLVDTGADVDSVREISPPAGPLGGAPPEPS